MSKNSFDEIYKKIIKKSGQPLPGFESLVDESNIKRAMKIYHYLEERAQRLNVPCDNCFDRKARKPFTHGVYETPWDENETIKHFCSEECETAYLYEDDFSYFTCQECEREICRQNPRNGWHIQYRDYDSEEVCLQCYQSLILENGIEEEKLEKGEIPGMFFSFGNVEAAHAGYQEVPGFVNFYVSGKSDANKFIAEALKHIKGGKKVVIGYESMAIGGLEGYVTLLEKDGENIEYALRHQSMDSCRN